MNKQTMVQYMSLGPCVRYRGHNAASQVRVLSKPSILGWRRYAFEGGMGKQTEKVCEYCGAVFVDRSLAQHGKYCSRGCNNRSWYKVNREKVAVVTRAFRKAHPEKWAAYQHTHYEANREKRNEYNRAWTQANLEKAVMYTRKWQKANPEKVRENGARYRAREKGAFVEKVNWEDICKRDKYTCQICGLEVKMNEQHPHPLSPSLDHIIPISKGGTHEWANVQLAHLRCNISKGNRINV